jgi:Prenyltransferase and squalene oxidase repeat
MRGISQIRHHLCLLVFMLGGQVCAKESQISGASPPARTEKRDAGDTSSKVLSPSEWQRLDSAIDRALAWLATQQQPDGSFPTHSQGQPGVTSLCVLAFMAHGHVPGDGTYGERLTKATRYIMACQQPNGLVTLEGPEGLTLTRDINYEIGVTAAYNHGISSLTLSEIYGMGQQKEAAQLSARIKKALAATLEMQRWPKDEPHDVGGWRYVVDEEGTEDSDLSITGWNLMFLRSARNAGFEVAQQPIDSAVAYVRRTFEREVGSFRYTIRPATSRSRAMAGAGILALAHAGFHNSMEAKSAAQWLLKHNLDDYNNNTGIEGDRYHYSLFNSCQAMYQMGSPYWEQFFPHTVTTLLAHQQRDGSWDAENIKRDRAFGRSYTTALVVLSLGAPNQFLPVFQR